MTTHSILSQDTVDSLNILIQLNYGKRLLDLEEQIFSNYDNSCNYAHSLGSQIPHTIFIKLSYKDPQWIIFAYVELILKCKWPVAEQFLKTHKYSWEAYSDYCD